MSDNPKFEIRFSDSFVKMACDKATQLLSDGKDNGAVDDAIFGKLLLFVDREPKRVLFVIPHDLLPDNLKGRKIFIGTNTQQ